MLIVNCKRLCIRHLSYFPLIIFLIPFLLLLIHCIILLIIALHVYHHRHFNFFSSLFVSLLAWVLYIFSSSSRLEIISRPLDIVYNPTAMDRVSNFFKAEGRGSKGLSSRASELQLTKAARMRYEELKIQTKQELASTVDSLLEGEKQVCLLFHFILKGNFSNDYCSADLCYGEK